MFRSFLFSFSKVFTFSISLFLIIYSTTNIKADIINSPDSINKGLNHSSDSSRLELLIKSANDYTNSNADLSLKFANMAIALAKKLNQPQKQIISEIVISKAYFTKGEYTKSIEQLDETKRLILSNLDSLYLIDIFQTYSLVYSKIGGFDKALEYSQNAFTLAGKLNLRDKLPDLVRETGNIYFSFGEITIALDFYQKSLKISNENNDQNATSKALNNLGRIYGELRQFDKALEYLNQSLQIKYSVDNKIGIANTLLNIGTIHLNQGDYNKAIDHFNLSKTYYSKANFVEGISNSLQYLGQSYFKLKQYKLSEESYIKALEIANNSQIRTLLVNIYSGLSKLYSETNRYNDAYLSLLKNKEIIDSIFSEERRNLLMEFDAKYNLQAKEKQIRLLSKEQELEIIQRKKLVIYNILLASTAFFLIFVIYLVYSRMRFRGTINRKLLEEISQRKIMEEELHQHQNHLEALVDDRTKDLKIAKDKAEESDMLKTAFLANMSHEIRTPMNAIVGFSNLLEHEESVDDRKEYVKQINTNSEILMHLINDIIDISMIESGQIKTNHSSVCILDLLKELVLLFEQEKHKINKGHININLEYDLTFASLILTTDPNRLKQILSNLISNALKFTQHGSIVIGFKQNNPFKILFFVKDTGIGIAPCNEEAIFERFSKFNSESETMLFPGTGLGLTICRELIHLLGGNIWFDSVLNEGSTFYFTLPATDADKLNNLSIITTSDLSDGIDLTGKTIIVAEDTISNFKLIKAYLKLTNVNLLWAKDGIEVMDMLKSQIVHLILMDIQMPIMDGIQTTKEIRKGENNIPIIILTAYTLNNEKDRSYAAGCSDYITKPIKKDELLVKISKYI